MEQAIAILTYGRWHFGGRAHSGHLEGVSSRLHYDWEIESGTWKITQSELDISWGTGFLLFPLPISPNGTPGFNGKGRAQLLVREGAKGPTPTPGCDPETTDQNKSPPEATPTPPIPADIQQTALIQTYHDSLVFVAGTAAAGSGFIATIGSANYLITLMSTSPAAFATPRSGRWMARP